ncbi:MAG: hypothetical protein GY696_10895 [Gammaproteobacteria bacterium]|nr:hypothetical protein [Gammaproteobacteria bacterium]
MKGFDHVLSLKPERIPPSSDVLPLLFGGVDRKAAKRKIPDRRQRRKIIHVKAENQRYGKNRQKIPPPFKAGDIVQFKRPRAEVRKGHSPKKRKKKSATSSKEDIVIFSLLF